MKIYEGQSVFNDINRKRLSNNREKNRSSSNTTHTTLDTNLYAVWIHIIET